VFVSLAASALFVVFLILPWGKASFLMGIAWITALAVRLFHISLVKDFGSGDLVSAW
jgi:hypothetical protein